VSANLIKIKLLEDAGWGASPIKTTLHDQTYIAVQLILARSMGAKDRFLVAEAFAPTRLPEIYQKRQAVGNPVLGAVVESWHPDPQVLIAIRAKLTDARERMSGYVKPPWWWRLWRFTLRQPRKWDY
jgi:hypothetical protein